MRNLAVFLIAVSVALPALAGPLAVGTMKCEYRLNPLGIDVAQPRLSWELGSAERGAAQQAYQVLVASDPERLAKDEGDLWDSGKVASDQSVQVAYAGKALVSEQRCFWKVRVWNAAGEVSPWSEAAFWSMGLLSPEDWKGKWIGLDGGDDTRKLQHPEIEKAQWIWFPEGQPAASAPVGVRWFRAKLALPAGAEVADATAYITADNECAVFVNGERVGSSNNYNEVKGFDCLAQLHCGDNVVAISAGNAGPNPNPAGLLGAVVVHLKDGNAATLMTDGTWRASADRQKGWEDPGFDDSKWQPAQVLGAYGIGPWNEIGRSDKSRLAARMLRKEFTADKPVTHATAFVCGLGLFELYVNGSRIGDQVLAPGQTEFNKRVFYMTFDVTEQVQSGQNAIGVMLGNGRFYAPRFNQPTKTNTFGYPKLLFQMRVEYQDGTSAVIVSDGDWKLTASGPIRANNEYDGEEYDARMELAGWDTPGFDAGAWEAAQLVQAPTGKLSAQMQEPIKVMETVKPVAVKEVQPGMFIYDMGQNMVGWCSLRVNGAAGTTVKMRFAETVKDDGTLYLDNIRGAEVTDLYTLKGAGDEVFRPRFVYHGFRYVEMTGFPGTPTLETIEGEVVHDAVPSAGHFACSNPLLNQIYKNTYWGVRGNYRSMPTDCPQRDERQGWLGDRSAECKGESYLFDISGLYGKWVTDMGDAQREDGSVSDVCPSYWPLYNDNVTWPSTYIIAPKMLYTQYADTRIIEAQYDGMKKWIDHMRTYLQDDLLPRDSYGDWCVPPEEKHLIHSQDERRKTPGELLGTVYFIYDLHLMAEYATMVGKAADRDEFLALADRMRAAFIKKYWNADKGYFGNGSETSQVLPLAFGIAPEETRASSFNYIANKIMNEDGGHLATGLVGGQWLMRTLSDNGRADIAYTIASKEDYPSWGYMIAKNATTIWELWNGDTADPAMNSHNHVMLVGDLAIWFHEYLAGIRPDESKPGFKHIIMKPYVVGDLTSAEASHNSLYGTISSAWHIADGAFVWDVTIPVNTTATIYVPVTGDGAVAEGGAPAEQAKGLKSVKREDGYAVFEAGAGTYRFSTPRG